MTPTFPPDREHRRRARLELGANVVVEAGAGTGKTTLLTDRLLFLLLGAREAPPVSSVVALTFTEKAAGEIKLRLSDRLAEVAAALEGTRAPGPLAEAVLSELRTVFGQKDGAILGRARAALEDLDRAQIGTIHSFAAHLLRLYPLQAGVDPGFRVDEGERFDELFAAEWTRWLDVELGEAPPRREEWLETLRLAPLEDLEAVAYELCGDRIALDSLGRPSPAAAGGLSALADAVERLPAGQPKPHRSSKILESIAAVAAHLRELAGAAAAADPPLPEALAHAKFSASKWPADWGPEGRALYERACALASASSAGAEAVARRATALVLPFTRSFRAGYARRGFLSFDGLLRKARDLVRDRPEVREELKERFWTFLIDEFQDTDPLQGELLLFLAERPRGGARRWEDVRLGPGRLFVVGDPKQSIYRFRGADIAAYQRFTRLILEQPGALACDLTANFRSAPALLERVNAVFSPLMVPEEGLQPPYKALLPGRGPENGAASVELVAVGAGEEDGEARAEAAQRAEAAWIADWIEAHCGTGKAHGFKEVAVLLRSGASLPSLLETFKARGIPYAVELERQFYAAPEIVDALNLLRVLDDPGDRVALAGLLRSPAGGQDDAALYRLARARGLDYEKAAAGAPELFVSLRELRAEVGRAPLGDLVREAFRKVHLLELCAAAYHGQQTVSNLLKLARQASEASEQRGLTLKEFIARAAAEARQPRGEGESPLADEHLEAVRVLTIHKSKGLEFPVVFLANASGASRGGGRLPVVLVDWASGQAGLRLPAAKTASAVIAWLEDREKERQRRESVRLLYVALTRAKRRLLVVGREKPSKDALSAWLAEAGAWGDSAWTARAAIEPRRGQGAPAAIAAAGGWPSEEASAAAWRRRLRRREEALARAWTSAPTDYLKEPEKRPVAREEPQAGPSTAAMVGRLCHKALEGWDFKMGGDPAAAVAAARRRLSALAPDPRWAEAEPEAAERLAAFVRSPQARELASVEILGREIPFAYALDGAVMRGSIDLLFRKDGRLVVADYKTGSPEGAQEKYALQGRAYREAVEKALGVSGVEFRLIFLQA